MAYSILNLIDAGGTATDTSLVSGTVTLSAGSRVIIIVCIARTTDVSTTMTDTNNNTWAKITGSGLANPGGAGMTYVAFECKKVTAAGATQITVNFSSTSTHRGMAGFEISGLHQRADVQVFARQRQSNPGTTTDVINSGSLAPVWQPALVLGYIQSQSLASYVSPGTGFSALTQCPNCSVVNGGSATGLEHMRITATSALTNGASFTDATHGGAGGFVTYGIVVSEVTASSILYADDLSSYSNGDLTTVDTNWTRFSQGGSGAKASVINGQGVNDNATGNTAWDAYKWASGTWDSTYSWGEITMYGTFAGVHTQNPTMAVVCCIGGPGFTAYRVDLGITGTNHFIINRVNSGVNTQLGAETSFTPAANDVYAVEFDPTTNKVTFFQNGISRLVSPADTTPLTTPGASGFAWWRTNNDSVTIIKSARGGLGPYPGPVAPSCDPELLTHRGGRGFVSPMGGFGRMVRQSFAQRRRFARDARSGLLLPI